MTDNNDQDYLKKEDFDGGKPKPNNGGNTNIYQEGLQNTGVGPDYDEDGNIIPPKPNLEQKKQIVKLKRANAKLRKELKKMSQDLTKIIEKNQYKYSGQERKREVVFSQKMLKKEIKTAKKQLKHYTRKEEELADKNDKGADANRIPQLQAQLDMGNERMTFVKQEIQFLKKKNWQDERKIVKQKKDEDYQIEMKQYIQEIKAFQGRLRKVKERRRIDEHNRKKVEERMKVVQDRYDEVADEYGVETDYTSTDDVMKVLRKKKKKGFQMRRAKGDHNVKKIYKTRSYAKDKLGELYEAEQEMPEDVIHIKIF